MHLARYAERAECDVKTFVQRVEAASQTVPEAPGLAQLVAQARRAGLSVASHDDTDATQRRQLSLWGCNVAEFPLSEDAAREARVAGDLIVFGAPNVLRGGSHVGAPRAEDMVRKGLCDVLTSDYYYPSPLLAAFDLARREVLSFPGVEHGLTPCRHGGGVDGPRSLGDWAAGRFSAGG